MRSAWKEVNEEESVLNSRKQQEKGECIQGSPEFQSEHAPYVDEEDHMRAQIEIYVGLRASQDKRAERCHPGHEGG